MPQVSKVFSEFFSVFPQYLIPKQALTIFAGKVANAEAGPITTLIIRWFIRRYGVNMEEAAERDVHHYRTFNEFFTRALAPGKRSISKADYVCPADGFISQVGVIGGNQILQAKGHNYSTMALVGGDQELADQFYDGHFATVYLSPSDYHRVHMPCAGRLTSMTYIPGSLFSVNPATARGIPGLFARNERVVCVFESGGASFVMVLVGATIVGSISTVWHGVVNPSHSAGTQEWRYGERGPVLQKGDEMGRFQLGSTVVMLFPKSGMMFNEAWVSTQAVRLGEMMATTASTEMRMEQANAR
ncbi:MAG: Phosphatidylserine decarboxylase [Nitrosospira sp.]